MNNTTTNLGLMHKILEDLRSHHVLECKFEKRMRETQTKMNWNTTGIISPYTTELDYNHFSVAEEGIIQGGSYNSRSNLKQTMRSIWKSVPITGELQRIQNEQFVAVQEEYGNTITDNGMLNSLAKGRAIELIFRENLSVYKRLKNFYAIQGLDDSAIATVTGLGVAPDLEFSWASTDIGNRMLKNRMKVQFYDVSAGLLRNQDTDYASPKNVTEQYSVVNGFVDPRPSVNVGNNGLVTFDALPTTALAAGDTVHVIGGRGAMPQGFLYWVGDTGNLLGESGNVARSSAPHIFASNIQNNAPATENTPDLMLAMEQLIATRTGEGEAISLEIWMNEAQALKYALFGLNSDNSTFNVQRFQDVKALPNIDVGVPLAGNSFNNILIEVDRDVPPSKNLWVDFLGWCVDEQTPDTIYEFHQDQQMWQYQSAYGEPMDSKQVTIFSQYNYRCTKFKTQGYQDDLAYTASAVSYAT